MCQPAITPSAPPEARPLVYVVDDQEDVLSTLTFSLDRQGFRVRGFRSAEDILSNRGPAPDCVLVDWNLGDRDGLDVAAYCREHWPETAVLLMSGAATLQVAVQAMRLGAENVLSKPIEPANLAREINAALAARAKSVVVQVSAARRRFDRLEPREREILKLVAEGTPNKNIAGRMDLAMRTIEKRRRHIFDTLEVDSAAEATRIYVLATLK